MTAPQPPIAKAFSLIEVLAAISIIGIIAFLAIPNIVKIKSDSEDSLAIARAEAVNMAIASYIQANGRENATTTWSTLKNDQARFEAVLPYLAFAPTELKSTADKNGTVTEHGYTPNGYTLVLPTNLSALKKTTLLKGTTELKY